MIRERVFINNGELYKERAEFEGCSSPYILEDNDDPVTPYYKKVGETRKVYKSTSALREFLGVVSDSVPADLSSYDLCPDVQLWAGIGELEGTEHKEVYFRVENSTVIKAVADYYSLPYPVTKEFEDILHNSPEDISFFSNEYRELVLASVKFEGTTPTMFKVYAYYKDKGKYVLMNRARVFCNGEVIETGGWYVAPNSAPIYESEGEGFKAVHTLGDNPREPLARFKSIITYDDETVAFKHYESSNMYRAAIVNMVTGTNYPGYNKAPHVKWWLGRSWFDTNNEEELYFHVESKEILDGICQYYNLPVPYDEELAEVLETNPKKIRYRSEDLNKLGEGKFVEIVLASVVFQDKVPTAIKLYEITRPDE